MRKAYEAFMKNVNLFILLVGTLVVSSAQAAIVTATSTTIKAVASYAQVGNGDVIFRVQNPVPPCYGYWVNKNDFGYDTNVSMILSAYNSLTPVSVSGLTPVTPGPSAPYWTGSGNPYCKLYQIQFGTL